MYSPQTNHSPFSISVQQVSEIQALAKSAGKEIVSLASKGLIVTRKEDGSPVTNADIESQTLLVRGIQSLFPGQTIVSEEHPVPLVERGGSAWYLDPVDGTKALIAGRDHYAVFIGHRTGDSLDFGIMHYPKRGITYIGGVGMPGQKNAVNMFPRISADVKTEGIGVATSQAINLPSELRSRISYPARNLALLDVCEGKLDAAVVEFPRPVNLWDLTASFAIAESLGINILKLEDGKVWPKAIAVGHKIPAGFYLVARPEKLPFLRAMPLSLSSS